MSGSRLVTKVMAVALVAALTGPAWADSTADLGKVAEYVDHLEKMAKKGNPASAEQAQAALEWLERVEKQIAKEEEALRDRAKNPPQKDNATGGVGEGVTRGLSREQARIDQARRQAAGLRQRLLALGARTEAPKAKGGEGGKDEPKGEGEAGAKGGEPPAPKSEPDPKSEPGPKSEPDPKSEDAGGRKDGPNGGAEGPAPGKSDGSRAPAGGTGPRDGPAPGWRLPPPEIPEWLRPWWEAVKYAVPGSEIAGALPDGRDALGVVIAKLNREMARELATHGDSERYRWMEQLRDKLVRIYRAQ